MNEIVDLEWARLIPPPKFKPYKRKYDWLPDIKTSNRLIENSKNAKEVERLCQRYLEWNYTTVIPQQWIQYKCKSFLKPKICCPDFICSTPFNVLVADAKANPFDFHAAQVIEYGKLVKFILNAKNDKRSVELAILYTKKEFLPDVNGVKFIIAHELPD